MGWKPHDLSFVWIISVLCVALASVACTKEGVSPGVRDVYLSPQEVDHFVLKADLANALPSQEPLDILLLFDATGSMGNVIDEARESATDIFQSVRMLYENSAFGVASFADYVPQGLPWQLHQDLTMDTGAVSNALRRIMLNGGGDLPEAYIRALHESRFLKWRRDARKYIVLFGDAPAHDPTFYGTNFGIDPGRDGISGTKDDLFLRPVVGQLTADGIAVIAVYDSGGWFSKKDLMEEAIKGFQFMAIETKGLSIPLRSAGSVADAIKVGVRDSYRPSPGIVVPAEYRTWVEAGEVRRIGNSYRQFEFDVGLSPPAGVTDGIYRFPLIAVQGGKASGGEIGHTWVTIRIGLVNYSWRWPLMLASLFLALLLLLARLIWGRKHGAIRYERNGQFWAALWRLAAVALVFAGLYAIWKYAPGAISDPPEGPVLRGIKGPVESVK